MVSAFQFKLSAAMFYERSHQNILASESARAAFETGNEILRSAARNYISITPGTSLRAAATEVNREMNAWLTQNSQVGTDGRISPQGLGYENGFTNIVLEFTSLAQVAHFLSAMTRDEVNHRLLSETISQVPGLRELLSLEQAGSVINPQEKARILKMDINYWKEVQQRSPRHFPRAQVAIRKIERLNQISPAMKALEVRVAVVEAFLKPYLQRGEDFQGFNPESIEFFDHALLLTLEYLEAVTDETGQKLFRKSDIVDAVNRTLVSPFWVRESDRIGPRTAALLDKLRRYDHLHPYLSLVIAAKLSQENQSRPSRRALKDYKRLPFFVEMRARARENETLRVPVVPMGPLIDQEFNSEPGSTSISLGLELVESWFLRHGIQLQDWSQVQGIPLRVLREISLEQRQMDLETHEVLQPKPVLNLAQLRAELGEEEAQAAPREPFSWEVRLQQPPQCSDLL